TGMSASASACSQPLRTAASSSTKKTGWSAIEYGLGIARAVEVDGLDAELDFGPRLIVDLALQRGQCGVGQVPAGLAGPPREQRDADMDEGAPGAADAGPEGGEGDGTALDVGLAEQAGVEQGLVERRQGAGRVEAVEVVGVFKRQMRHGRLLRRAASVRIRHRRRAHCARSACRRN